MRGHIGAVPVPQVELRSNLIGREIVLPRPGDDHLSTTLGILAQVFLLSKSILHVRISRGQPCQLLAEILRTGLSQILLPILVPLASHIDAWFKGNRDDDSRPDIGTAPGARGGEEGHPDQKVRMSHALFPSRRAPSFAECPRILTCILAAIAGATGRLQRLGGSLALFSRCDCDIVHPPVTADGMKACT